MDVLVNYLHTEFKRLKLDINIECDKNTMKTTINSKLVLIDFTQKDCIGPLFGFRRCYLSPGKHRSDKIINIQNVNNLRIECDLISGSFHNGQSTHTIYEFYPNVDPGYKIIEQPKHLVYLPVIKRRINTVNISILNQEGQMVNFRGEKITCRLHIKRDY